MRKLIAWAFMHQLDSGCVTYEAIAGALPTADHPFTGFMNAGRKVVERGSGHSRGLARPSPTWLIAGWPGS